MENVEVACGIPMLMQGYNLEDVARGIDETMFRQPLGVVAAITPFNFPAMIPLWFLPYAIALRQHVHAETFRTRAVQHDADRRTARRRPDSPKASSTS